MTLLTWFVNAVFSDNSLDRGVYKTKERLL